VHKKINALAKIGYQLVGTIPEKIDHWHSLRIGIFLFIKDNKYYQYRASSLFMDAEFNIAFDGNNEPLPFSAFSQIVHHHYIYVIILQKNPHDTREEKLMVILREDAQRSGHAHIAGPHQVSDSILIGGEIYFFHQNILLINHKSGSFRTKPEEAISLIRRAWGQAGVDVFHLSTESNEVLQEINKRKQVKIIGCQSPIFLPSSSSVAPDPAPQTSLFVSKPLSLSAQTPLNVAQTPLVVARIPTAATHGASFAKNSFFAVEAPEQEANDNVSTTTCCHCIIG
jgi:hypothetical protein